MSLKGLNWGKIQIGQTSLSLNTFGQNHQILSLDFKEINNSTVNKNDIIIQTAVEEVNNDDCICEIRLHVQCPKDEQQMEVEEPENDNDGQGKKSINYAQDLYKQIVQHAHIGEFAGQSIATVNEVNLVVPRGKYTIDFYQKNLRLHGITFNYNIDYKNILKGFLLPMANQSQTCIVLQLDKPIYQGQTVYPYVVIQVKKETQVQIKTKLKPEHQKSPHLSKLKAEYSGPLFEVLVELIKNMAQTNLIVPSGEFKSKEGQVCVKCGVKAQAGWLYFLKKSLIFIPKPVTYFKIDDIKKVEFNRLGSTNKQFDMKITLQSTKKSVQYGGIQRVELDPIVQYFKSREVKVQIEETNVKIIPDAEDDESEDADFEVNEGEDDSESDDDEDLSESESKDQNEKNDKGKGKGKGKEKQKEKDSKEVKQPQPQ